MKRGDANKADFLLSYNRNLPLAVLETKDNNHSVGTGMQQALDVIEHYNKAELLMLFDAVYGALKDTGVLLVQTPNADGPFGARHRYSDFTHELAFTPTSLSQALRMAGFKEIEFTPVEPIIHGPVSLMRWCAWKVIRLLLVAYLAVETGCLRGHVLTQNMIALARK